MMVRMQVHLENQEAIMEKLREAEKRPAPALKKAVNEAAKESREKLYRYIRKQYTVKVGRFPKRSLVIKKASSSETSAWIIVSHPPQSLRETYSSRKNNRREAARAAIKRESPKLIQGQGLKSFVAEMKNGHKGIFQRVPGTYMKEHKPRPYRKISGRMTKGRETIREAIGPSGAKLTEMAFRATQGELQQSLQEALWRFVDQAFR